MAWNPLAPYNDLPDLRTAASYESNGTLAASREAIDALQALEQEAAVGEMAREALEQSAKLREAWASCWIENVKVELAELVENQYHGDGESRMRQAVGAVRTWEKAIEGETPSTAGLEAWCTAMKRQPMRVRGTRVYIGNRYECQYMPPEGEERLREKLEKLWEFTNGTGGDPIVKTALAHYQFEAIHPFIDGNGRTGRMLNVALLARAALPGHALMAGSTEILQTRHRYYDLLRRMTESDCWEEWIVYYAGTITRAARKTRSTWKSVAARASVETAKWLAQSPRESDQQVLRLACLRMGVTGSDIAERHGTGNKNAVRRMLEAMRKKGIVSRSHGRGRRPYVNVRTVTAWTTHTPW